MGSGIGAREGGGWGAGRYRGGKIMNIHEPSPLADLSPRFCASLACQEINPGTLRCKLAPPNSTTMQEFLFTPRMLPSPQGKLTGFIADIPKPATQKQNHKVHGGLKNPNCVMNCCAERSATAC